MLTTTRYCTQALAMAKKVYGDSLPRVVIDILHNLTLALFSLEDYSRAIDY
ncbi:hypothetical protein [Methylobacter sp.]|uniref:hypothetical protein n=1 Tax=Methylobacter sp. TaxID=2051955 RepID=UPI0025D2580F|nr:hypothetical protein [Methylobacter sp.]